VCAFRAHGARTRVDADRRSRAPAPRRVARGAANRGKVAVMADTKALVYATGPDSEMRQACFGMLADQLAESIDRIDKGTLIIDPKGKQKVSAIVMAFAIVTDRERVPRVFDRLRRVPGVHAHALPILDSL
jgi:hypothetical protein